MKTGHIPSAGFMHNRAVNYIFKPVVHAGNGIVIQIIFNKVLPVNTGIKDLQILLGLHLIPVFPESAKRFPDTGVKFLVRLTDMDSRTDKRLLLLTSVKTFFARPLIRTCFIDQILVSVKALGFVICRLHQTIKPPILPIDQEFQILHMAAAVRRGARPVRNLVPKIDGQLVPQFAAV